MSYDAKAVKVPKSVKRLAATYTDPHLRGSLIKSYVKVLEADAGQRSSNREKKSK